MKGSGAELAGSRVRISSRPTCGFLASSDATNSVALRRLDVVLAAEDREVGRQIALARADRLVHAERVVADLVVVEDLRADVGFLWLAAEPDQDPVERVDALLVDFAHHFRNRDR